MESAGLPESVNRSELSEELRSLIRTMRVRRMKRKRFLCGIKRDFLKNRMKMGCRKNRTHDRFHQELEGGTGQFRSFSHQDFSRDFAPGWHIRGKERDGPTLPMPPFLE
jgi:hypothetical protein